MDMDGRGLFKVLLASFSKDPCCLAYVLLITGYMIALEAVDYPTFLSFGSWYLGLEEQAKYNACSYALHQAPKPNLTRQERLGLVQLKKEKDRVILTADKGVAIVIMDREGYVTKE